MYPTWHVSLQAPVCISVSKQTERLSCKQKHIQDNSKTDDTSRVDHAGRRGQHRVIFQSLDGVHEDMHTRPVRQSQLSKASQRPLNNIGESETSGGQPWRCTAAKKQVKRQQRGKPSSQIPVVRWVERRIVVFAFREKRVRMDKA